MSVAPPEVQQYIEKRMKNWDKFVSAGLAQLMVLGFFIYYDNGDELTIASLALVDVKMLPDSNIGVKWKDKANTARLHVAQKMPGVLKK
jgi:hypothetical protein